MKIRNIFLFTVIMLVFSCTSEPSIEVKSSNRFEFKIEEYGRYHNESILSILTTDTNKLSFTNIGELIGEMESEMKRLHPNEFSDVDYAPITQIFDLDQKLKDFKYDDLFFEDLKELALDNGAEPEMITFLDEAYYNGTISEKAFTKFAATSKNSASREQMSIFESFYNASKELWTKTAPKKFLVGTDLSNKGCDPQSQVIFADAVVGFIGALFTGPGGVLAGGGASLLIRTAQVEENNGGCI